MRNRDGLGYREAVHVKNNTVLTGIWNLESPNGRRIILVGTMHIGEPEYYDHLSKLLAQFPEESTQIHFEQIDKSLTSATREEVAVLGEIDLSALGAAMRNFAKPLGWVHQIDALKYPATAQNIDVSVIQLLRALGIRRLQRIATAASGLDVIESGEAARIVRKTVRTLPITMRLGAILRLPFYRILIEQRNKYALDAAERALVSSETVVLVWGAGHLPDMARRLARNGFTPRSIRLVRVGALPL